VRWTAAVVLLLIVACAAVWLLMPVTSPPAPRELRPSAQAVEPRASVTTSEARTPPAAAAPVTTSSTPAESSGDASTPDEDFSLGIETEGWVDLQAWRADAAARPLSARIARWRKHAARPDRGGGMTFEEELPPTLPPVRGVVRRRADRGPIGRARVSWSESPSSDDESSDEGSGTFTDATGRFELARTDDDGFEVGSGAFSVTAGGFAPAACFAGVGGEVEVWLDEAAAVEVTHLEDGSPAPRLEAVGGAPWLQGFLDAQEPDDGWPVWSDFDEDPAEAVSYWDFLPPGDYEVVGARTSLRLTLRAGETRRVRMDAPPRRPLVLTVLTPDQQPAAELDLRLTHERGRSKDVITDAQGRFEGQALEGTYRVTASLSAAPWQPELGDPVDESGGFHFEGADGEGAQAFAPTSSREFATTEVALGTIRGPGEHTLILPRLVRLELALSAPDELELPSRVDLLCLEPGHECLVTGDVKDGVARGALHPGRYAVFAAPDLLGEVDLPAARTLAISPQELAVRWLPGIDLDPEHAVRGLVWLSPVLLEGRPPPAWSNLPSPWDTADPRADFRAAQAHSFRADAHGRLAGDPFLARRSGGRLRFFASGRYVLEGRSDLGPFRVEVDLPAPGTLDVDLRPR
jgi:hypothetical protein